MMINETDDKLFSKLILFSVRFRFAEFLFTLSLAEAELEGQQKWRFQIVFLGLRFEVIFTFFDFMGRTSIPRN